MPLAFSMSKTQLSIRSFHLIGNKEPRQKAASLEASSFYAASLATHFSHPYGNELPATLRSEKGLTEALGSFLYQCTLPQDWVIQTDGSCLRKGTEKATVVAAVVAASPPAENPAEKATEKATVVPAAAPVVAAVVVPVVAAVVAPSAQAEEAPAATTAHSGASLPSSEISSLQHESGVGRGGGGASRGTASGGVSLLEGSFDEEESSASFAEALREWRDEGKAPLVAETATAMTAAAMTTAAVTAAAEAVAAAAESAAGVTAVVTAAVTAPEPAVKLVAPAVAKPAVLQADPAAAEPAAAEPATETAAADPAMTNPAAVESMAANPATAPVALAAGVATVTARAWVEVKSAKLPKKKRNRKNQAVRVQQGVKVA